jgi:LAGLIDADG DNA endonuclease family
MVREQFKRNKTYTYTTTINLWKYMGDGYLSKGAQRSIKCYYQEHFTPAQLEYRQWKLKQLENLGFSINGNYLRSPSNSYFTKLRSVFYPRNFKILPLQLLKEFTHPLFLTTLYLDDGTLVFSHKYSYKNHSILCHPSIILYPLT